MNENVTKHLQVLLDMAMKVLPYVVGTLAITVAVIAAVGVYSLLPFWQLYAYGYINGFWMFAYVLIFALGLFFIVGVLIDGDVGLPILGLHILCGALMLGFFLSSVRAEPTDSAFFRTEKGLVAAPQSSLAAVFYPFWEKGRLTIAHDTSGRVDYPVSLPDPASGKLANLKVTVNYTWSKDAVKADVNTGQQVDYNQQVGSAVETALAKWLKYHPDTIDAGNLKALSGAIKSIACQQAGGASCPVQLETDLTYTASNSQVSFSQDADGENSRTKN